MLRRRFLLGVTFPLWLRLTSGKSEAAFAIFQTSSSVVAAVIQQQNVPIGGIGLTRGLTMALDGTMLTWNDSVGPYKGSTAAIPGKNASPFTPWTQVIRGGTVGGFGGTNFPSSWLQAPTPYIGQGCVEIATVANNSSMMLAMICGIAGHSVTNLFKSTDGGTTWTLTNFPTNSLSSNNDTPPNPGQWAQSIAIDPNNNNNLWASDGTTVRVSLDGGDTWNTCASLPTAQCFAMAFDPTTPNRLVVGSYGNGLYVSTNANLGTSATFTLISASVTEPGEGRFGSDGTYYCTNGGTFAGIWRLTAANVFSQLTNASGSSSVAVDPNNPARVATWSSGNSSLGGQGVLIMNGSGSPANSGSPTFVAPGNKSMGSTPDAPHVGNSFNNVNGTGANGNTTMTNGNGLWFDPWTTTSTTTINLSSLSAGGSTGNITVPANIPNITVGRQLRCTNTGTPSNYFIFNVGSYNAATGVLSGTIIGAAQGFYLGGPIGGSGSFSAWTISAERVYMNSGPGGGPVYLDGFTSGTQNVGSCTFGLEGSSIYDIIWPVGGNPVLVTQDRGIFPVVRNPWNAGGGVVDCWGFGNYTSLFEATTLAVIPGSSPLSFITGGFSGFLINDTNINDVGDWNQPSNQPAGNTGVVAAANANVFVSSGGPGSSGQGMYYTQNAGASAWTIMPSPAPTSDWTSQAPFITGHTLDFDTTTTGPFVFYAWNNGDGYVYEMSVPASGTPTVTKQGQPCPTGAVPGPGCTMKCVPGHTGHLFWSAGDTDTSTSLSQVFSTHPNGGTTTGNFSRLQFSSNNGSTWTTLSSTQEVLTFGLGAPVTGGSGYPAIYAVGWCGGGQYGLYQCINFNPASIGSETWTLISNYIGTYGIGLPVCVAGDPNQQGRCIVGTNGNGASIFETIGQPNSWY